MNNESAMSRRSDAPPHAGRRPVAPPCDVYESADEYLIVADMPGVDDHTVDIKYDRSKLTIEARRTDGVDGTLLETEPQPQVYLRTFQVPEVVDGGQIKAELKQGVLRVHLPKGPRARAPKIAVTSG